MLPHERPLLTDAQLKQASLDQIEDLVHRINLVVQERGLPGVVWRKPLEDRGHPGLTWEQPLTDPPEEE